LRKRPGLFLFQAQLGCLAAVLPAAQGLARRGGAPGTALSGMTHACGLLIHVSRQACVVTARLLNKGSPGCESGRGFFFIKRNSGAWQRSVPLAARRGLRTLARWLMIGRRSVIG